MVEVMKLKEILLLAGVLALDMLTKFWVQSTMTLGQSIPVIRGFFNITYAQNTGAAWSLLEGKMMFFYIITRRSRRWLLLVFMEDGQERDMDAAGDGAGDRRCAGQSDRPRGVSLCPGFS